MQTLTSDVLKSSEIEGEKLDAAQVRSSIARRLGMDIGALRPADRHVEGVVEMMLDGTRNYDKPLTHERLIAWQGALFPTGRSGLSKIRTGGRRDDRTGPMQVISGRAGKERVHFEALGADRIDAEMQAFLDWFESGDAMDPVLKAGLAHLWFVTIHPFDDGNGRIARGIADMALSRSENSSQRFYSMSAQIRQERNDYYDILERTQKGTMNVTAWMEWFLGCLGRAIDGAHATLRAVLTKARFWDRLRDVPLNERQRLVINRLLDGFEGKLTSRQDMPRSRSAPRIRPTATFSPLLVMGSWSAIRKGAAARAIHLRGCSNPNEPCLDRKFAKPVFPRTYGSFEPRSAQKVQFGNGLDVLWPASGPLRTNQCLDVEHMERDAKRLDQDRLR